LKLNNCNDNKINGLKLPVIYSKNNSLFNNNQYNYNLHNYSFISSSVVFTKGTDSVLNTETKTRNQNKNRGNSLNEYAILNSISSDKSFNNYNNNGKNHLYDNHIIYEDDYLLEKKKINVGHNLKTIFSPHKNNNNLSTNIRNSLNNSPNFKGNSSSISNQLKTPLKNKNNLSIFNNNQSRNLAYSEQTKRSFLPKLINPYNQKENPFNIFNNNLKY
jgi:hypothetical protein